jgi:hypothetical protein
MARPLSSSQKPKWNHLYNFSVMTVGLINTVAGDFRVAAFNGTLKGLAAISSTAGTQVKDITSATVLYTISAANTAYIGTPQSPLFSYSYPAFNKISMSDTISIFAGIIGTIPDEFSVAVACFRSAAAQSITVANGPATLKYFKLLFISSGAAQNITVSAGTTDLGKIYSGVNSEAEMEFIHLGPGGPTISAGQNITITTGTTAATYLAGVFLLRT